MYKSAQENIDLTNLKIDYVLNDKKFLNGL